MAVSLAKIEIAEREVQIKHKSYKMAFENWIELLNEYLKARQGLRLMKKQYEAENGQKNELQTV